MSEFLKKIKTFIYTVMASKLGKFLFEALNVVALVIAMVFFFSHANILFGSVTAFCLAGTILSLIDKYKNKQ